MQTEQLFAVGRVVERLLVCLFAGASLTYGWNLFKVGVLKQQSATFAGGDWKVNLKSVGPGVFFALFGAIVLSISLRSNLQLPLPTGTSSTNAGAMVAASTPPTVIYAQGTDPALVKGWVASINTLQQVASPEKFASNAERQAISRALVDLGTFRDTLLIREFGADLFRDYKQFRQKMSEDPTKVTAQEQQRFASLDEWMQANRIQE